ncbi:MAG: hypothetical protein OEZ39_13210 [Gammaproteobacteria bacterium]|nr:hypothetical protein [Gammaproteobacteria bacterium]MDH5652808.1 hypothetical protein [Gammaproteobacteria bacterium]
MTLIITSIIFGLFIGLAGFLIEKYLRKPKTFDIEKLKQISNDSFKTAAKSTGDKALTRANEIQAADFKVMRFSPPDLLIIGGLDLLYSHYIELYFNNCSYSDLPDVFHWAGFRVATDAEIQKFSTAEKPPTERYKLYCIEAESVDSLTTETFYVAADDVTLVEGTVLHRLVENLNRGDRIAPWVLTSHEIDNVTPD